MKTGGKGFFRPQRPNFVLICLVGNFHITYYTHLLSLSTLAYYCSSYLPIIAYHTYLLLLFILVYCYFSTQSLPFLSFLYILLLLLFLLQIKMISPVLAAPLLFKIIRGSSPHNLPTLIQALIHHIVFHLVGSPLLHYFSLSLFLRISSIK